MSLPEHEVFTDGNMSTVVRIGNEVRRALPVGWKASHAVLRHLEAKGFPFSPRLVRHDDEYEWLTFMPGTTIPAELGPYGTPEMMRQVGELTRAYHDAMADFVAPEGIAWPPAIEEPENPDTICHNDIAPWNIVVDDSGRITGLIDWDLVRPGTRLWDLVYPAWRFGIAGGDEPGLGTVDERAARITAILDAYGLPMSERRGFIDLIARRQQDGFDSVEILGRQGVPGYSTLLAKGAHHWGRPAMDWLAAHRDELVRLVEP